MRSKPFKIVTTKSLMIALFIVLLIRGFLFEPTIIKSNQPADNLRTGDRLIVNKWSYGMRLPFTWIALPLIHDSIPILGIKSYSTLITTGYHRVFNSKPKSGDLIMINTPTSEGTVKGVPTDRLPLLITECKAGPGEAIKIKRGDKSQELRIPHKGERIPLTPENLIRYAELLQRFEMPNAIVKDGHLLNNDKIVNFWHVRYNYLCYYTYKQGEEQYNILSEEFLVGKAYRVWPLNYKKRAESKQEVKSK
ncbi:MAG: S26 family signal peptidase [Bacteroidales bacterium]